MTYAQPMQIDALDRDALDLEPASRSYRLREAYWKGTYRPSLVRKRVAGCGEDTLTGHAADFAALLEVSEPLIQSDELIVGCRLATPEGPEGIDLGYYNRHYPPGHETILRKGLPGIRDEARARLRTETDPDKRDFLRAVEVAYGAACAYVRKYALRADEMAAVDSHTEIPPPRSLWLW